ncbi:MAG TPA: F0F1 ATP synthase subunit delta [Candidatus Paceibacterota bacterium]|nr:F0F1 ATP synthase subunit delta [Candidatus Paceibacterota bacterium]
MKYPAHLYAKVLVEAMKAASTKDADAFADRFKALVRRNGDESHMRKILEKATRMARGKEGIRKVVIESARRLTPDQRKIAAGFAKERDVIQERIDPTLIAGIRIFVDDEREFDGSMKSKLDKLFG